MKYKFSAFGLSVTHPDNYKIWFNPNRPFNNDEGDFRVDSITGDKSKQVSLSVGWWTETEDKNEFAEKFLDQVEKQYAKTFKKKESVEYKFFEKKIIEHMGHKAAFVYCGAVGRTHAIKAMSKQVQLQTLELAWYCPHSKKSIIATIMAPVDYVLDNYDELYEMLMSITCHDDFVIEQRRLQDEWDKAHPEEANKAPEKRKLFGFGKAASKALNENNGESDEKSE